jgi:hypothetical protein
MRGKILKSKCLHVELSNQATEILSDIIISDIEDFKKEHGIKCTGVWDTGSQGCLISPVLAESLNLAIISYKLVMGVTSNEYSPEYLVNIFLPNEDSFEGVSALVGSNLADDEFIIGMSIINKGDFAITNVHNKTTMSFRCPSVARINFEIEYKKAKEEEENINGRQKKATRWTQRKRKRKKR